MKILSNRCARANGVHARTPGFQQPLMDTDEPLLQNTTGTFARGRWNFCMLLWADVVI